jgi:hypothetical protein
VKILLNVCMLCYKINYNNLSYERSLTSVDLFHNFVETDFQTQSIPTVSFHQTLKYPNSQFQSWYVESLSGRFPVLIGRPLILLIFVIHEAEQLNNPFNSNMEQFMWRY